MSNFKKTVLGMSWVGLLRGVTRMIAFLKIAVLARILTPSQFGLYGIAALVLAFVEILTETGINMFFVQKEAKLKDYINTAWVISIIRGILICSLIFISAPFISSFFQSRDSLFLIQLISLVPLIKGFINPSEALFQKDLAFKKEFGFRTIIFLVDAIVAVTFALVLKDPSSLLYGLIFGSLLEVLLSYVLLDPKPKFSFNIKQAKHIINRGKWFTGFGVFEYVFRNGDDIVVGKFLGEGYLGVYQMIYKLAILPITEVADVFGKVTLPVFVSISEEKKRLQTALLKTTGITFLILFPILLILFIFPELVIQILLGNQWISGAPVLQLLLFYALIRALLNPALTVFLAIKKQEYVAITSFIGTLTLFSIIFPLLSMYGINGIAIATILASFATIPFVLFYSWKIFK